MPRLSRRKLRAQLPIIGLAILAILCAGVVAFALRPEAPVVVAPAVSTPTPAPTPKVLPRVAFLGDSYTFGSGAGSTAERWTTRTSMMLGWDEMNAGVSGTGYSNGGTNAGGKPYAARVADVIAQGPAVVIVSGGRNDVVQRDSKLLAASTASTFADLRAGLPTAKLVALSPVWDATEPPAQLAVVAADVRTAVEAVGGTYVDIGQPLSGHPEAISKDGVHPNDAGHRLLANATVAALTKAGFSAR